TAPGTSGWSTAPMWSPDGTKLAYGSTRALDGSNVAAANGNIWVANADGSVAAPLTTYTAPSMGAGIPIWSPDGRKRAFKSSNALDGSNTAGVAFNVWVMNADGSSRTPLTRYTSANTSSSPAWSPDGTKLVFASDRALNGSDSANVNGTR